MAHLIDKDALVAEIERRRDKITKGIFSIPITGKDRAFATFEYEILGKVKDFLDTLEVKEVELTWKDVREICIQSVLVEIDLGGLVSDERHYTEVLKRFKEKNHE